MRDASVPNSYPESRISYRERQRASRISHRASRIASVSEHLASRHQPPQLLPLRDAPELCLEYLRVAAGDERLRGLLSHDRLGDHHVPAVALGVESRGDIYGTAEVIEQFL